MGIRRRAALRAFGLILASAAALPLAAQEPSKGTTPDTRKPAAEKKVVDSSRRVPAQFGQIGLSPEQKEAIYKIRGKRQAEIEALHKQIAQLQSEAMAECESVLSDTQKQLLALRRDAAARAKAAKSATAESTASSTKSEKPTN